MSANVKNPVKNALAAMFFTGICFSGANLTMPLLRDLYGLPYDTGGLMLSLLSVGHLVATIATGVLSERRGTGPVVIAMILGLALGYAMIAVSHAARILLLGFMIVGIGKGCTVNHSTVIAGNASSDRTGSINLLNAIYALGCLLTPLLFLAAQKSSFVKAPIIVMVIAGLMVSVSLSSTHEDDPAQNTQKETGSREFLHEAHFWLSAVFLFFEQCAELSVTSWLVTYFEDQGILSATLSELSVSVIWTAMLAGRLIIVFLLPPKSRLRSLTFYSLFSCISFFLLLSAKSGTTALVFLFIYGMFIAGCYPTSIAQASKSMNNLSMGIIIPIGTSGAVIMPYVVGAVADRTGIYGGMVCILASMICMLVSAILLSIDERVEAR